MVVLILPIPSQPRRVSSEVRGAVQSERARTAQLGVRVHDKISLTTLPATSVRAVVAPRVTVGEALVIDAEEVQDGGLEIVNVNGVLRDVVTEIVGAAVDVSAFHAAALHAEGHLVAGNARGAITVSSTPPVALFFACTSDAGIGCPCIAAIFGFGSNRSRCDGPPIMKRKMTFFARGAKCGCGAVARPSRASRCHSAIAPKPCALRARKSRREKPWGRSGEFMGSFAVWQRNTGILPVRPAGFQPALGDWRRLEACGPHSLEGGVPVIRG